jgi:hypothetical protein
VKSRLEAKKKKMQFDMKHKKEKKDPRSPEFEIHLISPELILASKAVKEELRGIKREMFSMNYQNSLTLTFNMAAENHAQKQAIVAVV